jgi:oligoendopeptidase F
MSVSRFSALRVLLLPLIVAALPAVMPAQERDRSKVPDKYKWNLAEIYPDVPAWRAAKERLAAEIPKVRAFQGKLASSPSVLADALELGAKLDKEISRLYVYASMLGDQDTRASEPQGMVQEMQQFVASIGAAEAFVEPEILKAGAATIDRFIASEPRLKIYSFYLKDVVRRAAHTLTDDEERILADATPLAASPSDTFGILANADFPYPSATLSDGKTAKLDQSGYTLLRALPNRADREKVMSTYFQSLGGFSRTYGTTMNGSVQKALFFAKARKYPTTLESSLDSSNIPVAVYTRLVEGVNKNLPAFHRYLKLRKRMMGVDQLHYYDLYAPLVGSVDLKYSPEEAEKLVLGAIAKLGPDYVAAAKRAFNERWIDLMPTEGKRSGAYSNGGAYDVHPYMLINYLGKYTDVSTVAHELGHTMQSYYSNKTQPYPLANYPIFVAEVASTFNEALLIDYMLGQIKDDATRLAMLGDYLENIKGTVFRQAQFAEFELRMHERAQAGMPLTGDALAKLYTDITRKYYGHDQGVCIVDDYVANEWSLVPHFYRDFYVYQYATSFTASAALSEKVLSGDEAAKKRYLAFLSAGGSKYPIDLLKDAGVDMTTDEPLDLTVKKMNRVMDEMEQLLAKMPPAKR